MEQRRFSVRRHCLKIFEDGGRFLARKVWSWITNITSKHRWQNGHRGEIKTCLKEYLVGVESPLLRLTFFFRWFLYGTYRPHSRVYIYSIRGLLHRLAGCVLHTWIAHLHSKVIATSDLSLFDLQPSQWLVTVKIPLVGQIRMCKTPSPIRDKELAQCRKLFVIYLVASSLPSVGSCQIIKNTY